MGRADKKTNNCFERYIITDLSSDEACPQGGTWPTRISRFSTTEQVILHPVF